MFTWIMAGLILLTASVGLVAYLMHDLNSAVLALLFLLVALVSLRVHK